MQNARRSDFTQDDFKWMIDVLHRDFTFYREQRSHIKTWCLTLWVGSLMAIASQQLHVNIQIAIMLLLIPTSLFWLMEAVYGGLTLLLARHITEVESRLSGQNFPITNSTDIIRPTDFLPISRHGRFTKREKLGAFIRALLFAETITVFYIAVQIGSLVFCLLFRNIGIFDTLVQAGKANPISP